MLEKHGDVTIAIDVMYTNETPFMMTVVWAVHFGTAEMIKNETQYTIDYTMDADSESNTY